MADIASVRFSLPSQLLEPVPNLGTLALVFGGGGDGGGWPVTYVS